jgi:predicted ABC-type ATPase
MGESDIPKEKSDLKAFDFSALDNLFSYLQYKLTNPPIIPSLSPWLIILYGPPGSGKSLTKNILIKRYKLDAESYLSINLDDILYDSKVYQDAMTNNNFKEQFAQVTSLADPIVSTLANTFKKEYGLAHRVKDIFITIGAMYKYNVVVEVTGITDSFMEKITKKYHEFGYNIYLGYPVVTKPSIIYDRILARSKTVCRIVTKDYVDFIIKNAPVLFSKKIITSDLYNAVLAYDADTQVDTTQHLPSDKIIYEKINNKILIDTTKSK